MAVDYYLGFSTHVYKIRPYYTYIYSLQPAINVYVILHRTVTRPDRPPLRTWGVERRVGGGEFVVVVLYAVKTKL